MLSSDRKHGSNSVKSHLAILATISLTLLGITGFTNAAVAGTPVDVYYSGNIIGTAVPASTTVDRDFVLLPASASVTGSRTGYTFGGWALTAGGVALTGSTYALTSTASRLDLHAVWNTSISYNFNGNDSGSLSGNKTHDVYRFGQSLTLPTAGTLAKSGFAFGGWMPATLSTSRVSTYLAGSTDVGNPTLYAAWIKTVTFNSNTATTGTIPAAQVFTAGGRALKLPAISEMTLRKSGHDFMGWSLSSSGAVLANPGSYVPLTSQQTVFAIWKLMSTKATSRVFFTPGKSALRPSQKLIIRDMVDSLKGKSAIKITLAATRPAASANSLAKLRNTAVVNYIKSLGVIATYTKTTSIGKANLSSAPKNNRVSIAASWTN
jgi:outer membrane protein OmpA-like peptidoglycan-associated protein